MTRVTTRLPLIITTSIILLMLVHGPISQPLHYHDFADTRPLFGLPNALDVLSNLGFAFIGVWGLLRLWPSRRDTAIAAGWSGYRLFLFALILTAAGSAFYHLRPENVRLIWDRIPIALACVGLLSGVLGETAMRDNERFIGLLIAVALSSVAWWHVTGDLRPYLLIQALPLVLIPLWQYTYRAPEAERMAFGIAIALYVAAKAAELFDHEILAALGFISGHTIKHLLATAAAATITSRLLQKIRSNRV
jgi:hypothetical protein